jgi:hypothetical protein
MKLVSDDEAHERTVKFKMPVRNVSNRATDGSSRGHTSAWFEQQMNTRAQQLLVVPPDAIERVTNIQKTLKGINDDAETHGSMRRQNIRQYNDLKKELTDAHTIVSEYESGKASADYRREATEYLRMFKMCKVDTEATGSVENSLTSMSETQSHRRYRKRSDLDHIIRMASRSDVLNEPQRHSIVDEFMSSFHQASPPVYLMHGDMCPRCDTQMRKSQECGGCLECPSCGSATFVQDSTSTTVSFGDDIEYSNFTYKRDNHFQEWLNQCMAKQNYDVPKQILDDVMTVLHRERIKPESVNAKKVREALKEKKHRKYYEHAMLIACNLTGREPPRMEPVMEDRLRSMFRMMQQPFEQIRDTLMPERKNFLSYSYVLFKLCELDNELEQFKQCFSLLKGRDKLYRQDQVWKCICDDLGWTYIPSI